MVFLPLFSKKANSMENLKPNQYIKQGFPFPPPSNTRKWKAPENCYLSVIDQVQDGLYTSSKLVRNEPRKTSDSYFIVKTFKDSVGSFRRNYSHRNVALFRTKRDGSTRGNIAYLTCSFVEMDGSIDNTIKTQGDVQALVRENNLPKPSYVIETSIGHYHILWTYSRPLPWSNKGESYWLSQQTKLIELFQKDGFNVDTGASLNPCQNLRNFSQLHAYNYKRRCEVQIHSSYQKTSLRAIYKALNRTNIPNPRPMKASTKLRRYMRANKTFEITLSQLAENLNMSLRTVKTQVSRAIANGDLRIIARLGNNGEKARTTHYESLLYIEKFPEVQLSISNNNVFKTATLLRDFQAVGAKKGRRNRTIFMLGLHLKAQLGKRASTGAIRDALEGGAMRCHVPVREFEKTLRNIMKNSYTNPLSKAKLQDWGLLEETRH